MTSVDVFAGISVLYMLVLVAGMVAWRSDRDRRGRDAAERVAAARRETNTLKIQLADEIEHRRSLEGYYILDDSANLDPQWRTDMRWAAEELRANDPEGRKL